MIASALPFTGSMLAIAARSTTYQDLGRLRKDYRSLSLIDH
jgi:hypothetical protein